MLLCFGTLAAKQGARNYIMCGKQYNIEINDANDFCIETLSNESSSESGIIVKNDEIDLFIQELSILERAYIESNKSIQEVTAPYSYIALPNILQTRRTIYANNGLSNRPCSLIPWLSIANGKYSLYIKTFEGDDMLNQNATGTYNTIMFISSPMELRSLIDALNPSKEYNPIMHASPDYTKVKQKGRSAVNEHMNTTTKMNYDMVGLGIAVNSSSLGADIYYNKFIIGVMSGYAKSHLNYKDYLDINFANAYGDTIEKTYSQREGFINIGRVLRARSLIAKACVGIGKEQDYYLIDEGNVSIFGGKYTIQGEYRFVPNINVGTGIVIGKTTPFILMIHTNINSVKSDVGIVIGFGFTSN